MPVAREEADVATSSAEYARRFAGGVGAWFLEVQAKATLELLAPWPGGSVLDVGGGHGQLTGPLVEGGHDVTVFGSQEVCGERVRAWTEPGRARFRSGDLLALPFPDGAFDVALAFRLLPHVSRWRTLLAELARVARRAVILDYPTSRSVNAASRLLFSLKKGVEGDTRPFTVFRDVEIEEALAACGLRVTGRRPQFLLPMAFHRAVGSAGLARTLEAAAALARLTRWLGSPVILRAEHDA